jgi:hypothetical protein
MSVIISLYFKSGNKFNHATINIISYIVSAVLLPCGKMQQWRWIDRQNNGWKFKLYIHGLCVENMTFHRAYFGLNIYTL